MNELKSRIRKKILKKRGALNEREVREKSLIIKERFFRLREFKNAELIMFYASFKNEVRTEEMIEEAMASGKKIVLPVTTPKKEIRPYLILNLKEDLTAGRFGIPEPVPPTRWDRADDREVNTKEIDMIIVPGVAFDRKGGRIGFGQGFYDRFLRSISPCASAGQERHRPFCVGLSFEIQVLDNLPLEKYDEKLDMVITESQIYAAE